MAGKKTTAVAKVADEKALEKVGSVYAQEQGGRSISFPRIGLYSQDVTEGKGKQMKVVTEAGTFYIERETDEVDASTGKKIWEKEEIGTELEVIIYYKRYQLQNYDGTNFTNSPIYDLPDEVIPLFSQKKEVKRGTPKELKADYMYTDPKTKKQKCALEENRVLYVIRKEDNELYQINLRGSSMYELLKYERNVIAPTVVTKLSSEYQKKGDNEWNKMTFSIVRKLNADEAEFVEEKQGELIKMIADQKAGFEAADKPEGNDPDDF